MKTPRQLTTGQLAILEILYKYRFANRDTIAGSLKVKSNSTLFTKLENLVTKDYIAKQLDKTRLSEGISALYYLRPKGYTALRDQAGYKHISESDAAKSYRDKQVSDTFKQHVATVYSLTQHLRTLYPSLRVLTPRDMSRHDYFLTPQPDAFLSLPHENSAQPMRFHFYLQPVHLSYRNLQYMLEQYDTFFEDGKWAALEALAPHILFVIQDANQERTLKRQLLRISRSLDTEPTTYITSLKALLASQSDSAIWTNVGDEEEIVSLDRIRIT